MRIKMSNITLEESKTGHLVPIVDDNYLHSIFNPIKEAQSFVVKNIAKIESSNEYLILGLGFGYHVNELQDYCIKRGQDYKITILEPNRDLIDLFYKHKPDFKFEIFHDENMQTLFERNKFVSTLLNKPTVIPHMNSFNLNKEFFKSFLMYNAPSAPNEYNHLLSKDFSNYLGTESTSIEEHIKSIDAQGRSFSKKDFMTLAFNEIINN